MGTNILNEIKKNNKLNVYQNNKLLFLEDNNFSENTNSQYFNILAGGTIINALELSKEKDLYTIKVYGDLHYHNLIDTRNNLTESQMQNSIFNLNEYMNEASTVTYTFKTENDKYYFYSSNVTNK